jgi:hypothetical protein
MAWMAYMSQGVKEEVVWGDLFPQRPISSNCYNSFSQDQLFSVYLLEDEKTHTLKQNLLVATVGEEIEVLSKLIIDDETMCSRWENIQELKGWEFIKQVHLPCTDIIIADPYILSDENLFEQNLYELIMKLCSHLKDNKVNIVIFSMSEYNKGAYRPDISKISSCIKNKVKTICRAKPNVTFIVRSKKVEHDRMIVTNYNAYVSGDSFNYFDSSYNLITTGRNFQSHSLAGRRNLEMVKQLIRDLQSVTNEIKALNNPDLIQGDKKSLFLNLC